MCPPGFTSEDYSDEYMDRIPTIELPKRLIPNRVRTHFTINFTSEEQYDYGPIFRALGGLVASPLTYVEVPE